MKTTPYDTLEVALNWLPLDLFVKRRAETTVYRLLCQGEWTPASAKHARLDYMKKHPITLKQDRFNRKYQIRKAFKTYVPERENWKNVNKTEGTKVHWYTDGSGIGEDHRDFWSLRTLSTVFQTEVFAIYQCARLLNNRSTANKYIYIWSDSQAAIKTVLKPMAYSQLVWETMEALENLGQRNKVTLAWVPGHTEIQGNERADGLARKGMQDDTELSPVEVPSVTGLNQIKSGLQQEHLRRWKDNYACKIVGVTMPEQSSKRVTQLISMNRRKLSTIIRLLTGHGMFKFHSKTIGIGTDATCWFCEESKEDSQH